MCEADNGNQCFLLLECVNKLKALNNYCKRPAFIGQPFLTEKFDIKLDITAIRYYIKLYRMPVIYKLQFSQILNYMFNLLTFQPSYYTLYSNLWKNEGSFSPDISWRLCNLSHVCYTLDDVWNGS